MIAIDIEFTDVNSIYISVYSVDDGGAGVGIAGGNFGCTNVLRAAVVTGS